MLANTLGNHKHSRRWTWHSPDGTHHNQIDYLLVKKRFRSGIKTARTRTSPGADVGSNHDMVMMTFQTRLKNSRKPTQPRIRFDLEKLNNPTVMSVFQATIGGRFAPLAMLVDEDADLDSMVTHFSKTQQLNFLASNTGRGSPGLLLSDQRRDLKKKRGEPEGAKDYREIKRKIRTEMKMANRHGYRVNARK